MPLPSSALSLARSPVGRHDMSVTPADTKLATSRATGESSESLAPKEKRPRRTFSAAEKLQIVREYDACKRGERGALLRRYGIYSSSLLAWRQQLQRRGIQGLEAQKPGRKSERDEKDTRIAELEKKLAQAEKKLSVAKSVIEFQKKVSAMLQDESDSES